MTRKADSLLNRSPHRDQNTESKFVSMKEKKHNKGGRPRLFTSVEQLQGLIEEYFAKCDRVTKDVVIGPPSNRQIATIACPDPYDVAGLCAHLGCSRETLSQYQKDPKYEAFSDTIKKAKLRIEADMCRRALKDESNGAVSIFLLKHNYGYKDKSEHEHTGRDGKDLIPTAEMTREDIMTEIEKIRGIRDDK